MGKKNLSAFLTLGRKYIFLQLCYKDIANLRILCKAAHRIRTKFCKHFTRIRQHFRRKLFHIKYFSVYSNAFEISIFSSGFFCIFYDSFTRNSSYEKNSKDCANKNWLREGAFNMKDMRSGILQIFREPM